MDGHLVTFVPAITRTRAEWLSTPFEMHSNSSWSNLAVYTPDAPRVRRYPEASACASNCGPKTSRLQAAGNSMQQRISSAAPGIFPETQMRSQSAEIRRGDTATPSAFSRRSLTFSVEVDRAHTLNVYVYHPGASILCVNACGACAALVNRHAEVPLNGSSSPSLACTEP